MTVMPTKTNQLIAVCSISVVRKMPIMVTLSIQLPFHCSAFLEGNKFLNRSLSRKNEVLESDFLSLIRQ